jgi:hypothetical protein
MADFDPVHPMARSSSSNGTRFIAGVDGRTQLARRARDVAASIAADFGGSAKMGEAEKQLARRAAMLSAQCEQMEAACVRGEPFDLEAYGKLVDRLGRTFSRLGFGRLSYATWAAPSKLKPEPDEPKSKLPSLAERVADILEQRSTRAISTEDTDGIT